MLKFVLGCNIVVLTVVLVAITVWFVRFLKAEYYKAREGKSKFFQRRK